MKQVVSNISQRAYHTASEDLCKSYLQKYALSEGPGNTQFQILPYNPKRLLGNFGEQMQVVMGVYVPTNEFVEADSLVKRHIVEFIRKSEEPVKRHEIIQHLANINCGTAERKVRSLIEELINEDGVCIQSSEEGFQMIESEHQLKTAIKYLRNKAFPLFERASSLQKNFYRDKTKQLSFEEFFSE